MVPTTLDKSFLKQDEIEEFYSLIWTERFYGDSEVELVVPLNGTMLDRLKLGTFLSIEQSKEPMIVETLSIEDGQLKVMGVSLLYWLNNRFVRTDADHRKREWTIKKKKAGDVLGTIVKQMCTKQSDWLYGSKSMGLGQGSTGISREKELAIPNLTLGAQDKSGKTIPHVSVPYGPVYDALRAIAEQHKIGMTIELVSVEPYSLKFRTYKGANRTSKQQDSPAIRFSPVMDSFSDIKELRSNAEYSTLVYAFASDLEKVDTSDSNSNPDTWLQQNGKPGIARRSGEEKFTGFELRAKMIMVSDIKVPQDLDKDHPTDPVSVVRADVVDTLMDRANRELNHSNPIKTVDGEVSPLNVYRYKRDYFLGDIIEVQGNTGLVEDSRVMEYIRTQDADGERSYPTVMAVNP